MGFAFIRKRKKKGADLVHHFNRRCMQRIGVVLPQDELKRRMNKNQLTAVRKMSNTRTLFLIPRDMLPPWHRREMLAVYDKERHSFVTVVFRAGGSNYDTSDSD